MCHLLTIANILSISYLICRPVWQNNLAILNSTYLHSYLFLNALTKLVINKVYYFKLNFMCILLL